MTTRTRIFGIITAIIVAVVLIQVGTSTSMALSPEPTAANDFIPMTWIAIQDKIGEDVARAIEFATAPPTVTDQYGGWKPFPAREEHPCEKSR